MAKHSNRWEQFYKTVEEIANCAEKSGVPSPLYLRVFETKTRQPVCRCPLIKLKGQWVFVKMTLHTAQDHPAALFATKWTTEDHRFITVEVTGLNFEGIEHISFDQQQMECATYTSSQSKGPGHDYR